MTSHTSKDKDQMKLSLRRKPGKNGRGQIGVLFIMSMILLIIFVGLSIDLGLAYVTKTTLGKAVDAAALTAMKNVSQGTGGYTCNITSAAGLAGDEAFNINYKSVPNLGTTPVPNVCFSLDANNNTLVTVTATATINTYFIRLAGYNTLNISSTATAQRNPMVMSLVLDASYSMTQNGGSGALPTAVNNFIADFNGTSTDSDTIDTVSVVTFGTYATVTVPNSSPFQSKISGAITTGKLWPGGINYTNSQAGLAAGQGQILLIPKTTNLLRVLVFFTDGWPNIQQDTLTCQPGTKNASTADLLYCGCDVGDESLGLCGSSNVVFFKPSSCASDNTCSKPSSGCGSFSGSSNPQTFSDQQTGATEELKDITWCGGPSGLTPNSDSMYRSVLISTNPNVNLYSATWNAGAAQVGMLHQDTYVYAIGMGTAITGQPAAQEFLREVANDPAAATFDSTLPVGSAVFASDSSQLNEVFQEIAAKILLRLSK
jgi:Flp pilus assembly protein TadG